MDSTLEISRPTLDRIVAHGASSRDEICGLLLRHPSGEIEARGCANIHLQPAARFELDPAALLAAHRAARGGGPAVIGQYPSHPSGTPEPSAEDAAQAAADGAIWVIVAGSELRAWRALDGGSVHGRFDSVAIIVREACA